MRAGALPFGLLLGLFALAGCNSVTRLDGNNFEAARVPVQRFETDTAFCGAKATDDVTYDVRVIDATGYARNRAYNATYSACMKGLGYAPRPYLENVLPDFSTL